MVELLNLSRRQFFLKLEIDFSQQLYTFEHLTKFKTPNMIELKKKTVEAKIDAKIGNTI